MIDYIAVIRCSSRQALRNFVRCTNHSYIVRIKCKNTQHFILFTNKIVILHFSFVECTNCLCILQNTRYVRNIRNMYERFVEQNYTNFFLGVWTPFHLRFDSSIYELLINIPVIFTVSLVRQTFGGSKVVLTI